MENQYQGQEKRQSRRLLIRLAMLYRVDKPLFVRMQVGNKEVLATTIDLSEGGIAISSNYDIPVKTVLLIKFTLYRINFDGKVKSYGPMEIIGEVRYNTALDKKRYRLGICFTKLNEKDKSEIRDFVNLAFK
jgi:c-di-GMP-binding flagellar brake protein YcgR